MTSDIDVRTALVRTAADLFLEKPYLTVDVADVAVRAGIRAEHALSLFPDTHAVATAVLDLERAGMREVRTVVEHHPGPVVELIPMALRMVGENLAQNLVIRAGVTLAAEARRHFPERPLDPFRTWMAFLGQQLGLAQEQGELCDGVDLEAAAWLITSSGMGTMDFVRTRGLWSEAPNLLWQTAHDVCGLVAVPPSTNPGKAA